MTHSMFPGAAGRCYVLHSTSEEAHDCFQESPVCFQEPPVDVTSYTAPVKKLMTHSMFPGVAGRCYVLHSYTAGASVTSQTSGEAHDTFYVSRSRL